MSTPIISSSQLKKNIEKNENEYLQKIYEKINYEIRKYEKSFKSEHVINIEAIIEKNFYNNDVCKKIEKVLSEAGYNSKFSLDKKSEMQYGTTFGAGNMIDVYYMVIQLTWE